MEIWFTHFIHVPKIDAYTFGYIVYFFQKLCAMGGYLFQVNPFNPPLIEAYKKNMYTLLVKPRFKERQAKLKETLKRQELDIEHTYSHLYNILATELRFFTVYGPMDRPDISYFGYTDKFFVGETIKIFNNEDFENIFIETLLILMI